MTFACPAPGSFRFGYLLPDAGRERSGKASAKARDLLPVALPEAGSQE